MGCKWILDSSRLSPPPCLAEALGLIWARVYGGGWRTCGCCGSVAQYLLQRVRPSTRPREAETSRSTGGVFSGRQPARPPTGITSCLSRDLTRKTRSPRNEPLSDPVRACSSGPPSDTGNSKDKSRRGNRTHLPDSQIDGLTRPFAPDLGLPVCVPSLRCSPCLFPDPCISPRRAAQPSSGLHISASPTPPAPDGQVRRPGAALRPKWPPVPPVVVAKEAWTRPTPVWVEIPPSPRPLPSLQHRTAAPSGEVWEATAKDCWHPDPTRHPFRGE